MTRRVQLLSLLVMLLSVTIAYSRSPEHAKFRATFVSTQGDAIRLDVGTGSLTTPRSQSTSLQDCGDEFQVCLTDHHGFAFAYFRKCDDATSDGYRRLRFSPKVVTVVHNSDMWMVFDASPKYLFHYAFSKGIVGIYMGPTPSFDFRSVLHRRNFQVESLDAFEYRYAGPDIVAACSL